MKKTPLKRFSSLKRGTKGLKKSRLAHVSKKKKAWQALYSEAKAKFGPKVRCAQSGLLMHRHECDPHHPMGQQGEYILCFVWISKWFHRQVHDFGTQSRELGWLLAPYEGRAYDSKEPRPWKPEFESHFPEKFKRPA